MGSSERAAGTWRAYLRQRGLDEGWTVRFTAGGPRAREMAGQYRAAGFRVRILPLSPEGEELEPDAFDRFEGAGHDPLGEADPEVCAPCLEDTYLLLTKRASTSDPAGEPGGEGAS